MVPSSRSISISASCGGMENRGCCVVSGAVPAGGSSSSVGLRRRTPGDARFSVEQGPEIRIDGPFVYEQRLAGVPGWSGRKRWPPDAERGRAKLDPPTRQTRLQERKSGRTASGEPNGILIERIDEEAERKDERPEKGEQNIKEDGGGTLHVCSCL